MEAPKVSFHTRPHPFPYTCLSDIPSASSVDFIHCYRSYFLSVQVLSGARLSDAQVPSGLIGLAWGLLRDHPVPIPSLSPWAGHMGGSNHCWIKVTQGETALRPSQNFPFLLAAPETFSCQTFYCFSCLNVYGVQLNSHFLPSLTL